MAQKTVVHLFDDLDQTELVDTGRTVTFALQKAQYEIDLSEPNAAKLFDALAPFIAAGRRVSSSAVDKVTKRAAAGNIDVAQTQAMRQWAKAQGMNVNDRGRMSQAVRDAYHTAADQSRHG